MVAVIGENGVMSFRMKALLSFAAVAALCLGFFAWRHDAAMESLVAAEQETRARRDMDVLQWSLRSQPLISDEASLERLDNWAKTMGRLLRMRVTYIRDGRILADSDVLRARLPSLQDHSDRPEILQALAAGEGMDTRRSATLHQDLIYHARSMSHGPLGGPGVLRLAVPVSLMQEQQHQLRSTLLLSLGLACGVMLLLGSWLSRSFSRSIASFAATAFAISQGDHSRKLHAFPGREFEPLARTVNTLAQDMRDAIHMLEARNGQLEALFNGMTEGVLLLDDRGACVEWNAALAAMLGMQPRHHGRQILEVTREPALQHAVERLLAGEPGQRGLHLARDGRDVDVTLAPIPRDDGGRGAALVFRDVTELRRLERVRRDFVANASHEMRTPLTTIAGNAETLLDQDPLDPALARRFLASIHRAAWRLTGLVDGMLTLSRLEAGAWRPELVAAPLAPLVKEAWEAVHAEAERRGVHLQYDEDPEAATVLADREGLLLALRNLLENAVRHGPDGGRVAVAARRVEARCLLTVRDQGPGVPREERERIFERFYRLSSSGHPAVGFGLGLAIARHTLRGMGGDVRLLDSRDSLPGGACFAVDLPLPDSSPADTA